MGKGGHREETLRWLSGFGFVFMKMRKNLSFSYFGAGGVVRDV